MDSSVSNLPHVSIASVWWPARRKGFAVVRRAIVLAAFGVALLAVSAKINLPLPYVPMTLQTLVVLMIGAVYGWRLGTLTIIAYLAVGALGLPVFAGPVGGLKPLTGATAGFLSGFVVAAFVTGWFSERGWDRSMVRLFVAMAIGHIVIMAMGFAWLAYGMKLGAEKAWLVGVMPFLAGALVKNTLGAILVPRPARNG
jgi:biotin transport system substrate-specific component